MRAQQAVDIRLIVSRCWGPAYYQYIIEVMLGLRAWWRPEESQYWASNGQHWPAVGPILTACEEVGGWGTGAGTKVHLRCLREKRRDCT